jgi:multicomponent Na+:H+ antiporter subunit F
MIAPIVTYTVVVGLLILALGIFLCVVRAYRGPTLFDRVMSFDAIALNLVGATLLISILLRSDAFMDVVLVVALLGFLGAIALASYLEGTLVDSD